MTARRSPEPDQRRATRPAARSSSSRGCSVRASRRCARRARDARTPEARLEEAVGLARAIDLDVVEARHRARSAQIRPATYIGKGKVEEIAGLVKSLRGRSVVVMDCALSPVQQRNLEKAWSAKVHRPHRPDPRDLRPARAHARRRAAGRARASDLSEAAAWCGPGPIWSASAAASAFSAAPAKPRSKPTAALIGERIATHRSASSRRSSARASCIATAASACRIRSSRWSATPTPASRRCSTA